MPATKQSTVFLIVLFVLFSISAVAAYYKYMVQKDFRYFTTTEQVPDRFNVSSYK